MARKPPTAYATVELTPDVSVEEGKGAIAPTRGRKRIGEGAETLKGRAKHVMIYPSHEFWLALKRYALESGADVKPHDVIVEILQNWCDTHGINVRVRVPSRDRD